MTKRRRDPRAVDVIPRVSLTQHVGKLVMYLRPEAETLDHFLLLLLAQLRPRAGQHAYDNQGRQCRAWAGQLTARSKLR